MNYYNNNRGNTSQSVRTVEPKEVPELNQKTYVKQAEDVIKSLKKDDYGTDILLSTSQIRNLLTLTNEVYNVIQHDLSEKLSDEIQGRTQYIKMRIAYSAGRDQKAVKDFVDKSSIMIYLDRVGDSRKKLMLVCNYMEALVAYHRFYRKKTD